MYFDAKKSTPCSCVVVELVTELFISGASNRCYMDNCFLLHRIPLTTSKRMQKKVLVVTELFNFAVNNFVAKNLLVVARTLCKQDPVQFRNLYMYVLDMLG